MNEKKVIAVIVEGPSDENAIGGILKEFFLQKKFSLLQFMEILHRMNLLRLIMSLLYENGYFIAAIRYPTVKPHFIPDDFCKLFQSKSPVIKCGNDNDSKLFQS